MFVYVLNKHGEPLMPCKPKKARLLLNSKKAKVVKQTPFTIQLFDKISYEGQECFIFGRRKTGYFDLRLLDGTVIHRSASFKKIKLKEKASSWLVEKREYRSHSSYDSIRGFLRTNL